LSDSLVAMLVAVVGALAAPTSDRVAMLAPTNASEARTSTADAMLLKQGQEEQATLRPISDNLVTALQMAHSDFVARVAAENKAEEAQRQLSVQKLLDVERLNATNLSVTEAGIQPSFCYSFTPKATPGTDCGDVRVGGCCDISAFQSSTTCCGVKEAFYNLLRCQQTDEFCLDQRQECNARKVCPSGNRCLANMCIPYDGTMSGCFAKEHTAACRLLDHRATAVEAFEACYQPSRISSAVAEPVLMRFLTAGDMVLTAAEGALDTTRVLTNQHAASHDVHELLTLHTAAGASLSLTADHAIFVDGALKAARDATRGSLLIDANGKATRITRITHSRDTVINPVTAAGTILASDAGAPLLVASHPMWIAPLLLATPVLRIVANAAIAASGDAVTVASFATSLVAKFGLALGVVWGVSKVCKHTSR